MDFKMILKNRVKTQCFPALVDNPIVDIANASHIGYLVNTYLHSSGKFVCGPWWSPVSPDICWPPVNDDRQSMENLLSVLYYELSQHR